jgi:membrane protein involved in colicin uptake
MLLLTNKLIIGLFLLSGLIWSGSYSAPAARAYDSPEALIMEEELRQAALYYEQQQREAARLQQQLQRQQRVAKELEGLISKASAQHAKIRQWEKKNAKGLKTQTKTKQQKKRVQVAVTIPR